MKNHHDDKRVRDGYATRSLGSSFPELQEFLTVADHIHTANRRGLIPYLIGDQALGVMTRGGALQLSSSLDEFF